MRPTLVQTLDTLDSGVESPLGASRMRLLVA